MPSFFNPRRGVCTFRICRLLVLLCSELGIVALNPRSRLTLDATPSGSGTSASSSSSVASKIWRSPDVIRLDPSPSRSGARPRVANPMPDPDIDEPPKDARDLEETVAAEFIIRGVIITGATAE